MAIIKLGNQQIECSDDAVAKKINAYISDLEGQLGHPRIPQYTMLGNTRDSSDFLATKRHIDGTWEYTNPVVKEYTDSIDNAWQEELERCERDNSQRERRHY